MQYAKELRTKLTLASDDREAYSRASHKVRGGSHLFEQLKAYL
jgi:hypothetical protein